MFLDVFGLKKTLVLHTAALTSKKNWKRSVGEFHGSNHQEGDKTKVEVNLRHFTEQKYSFSRKATQLCRYMYKISHHLLKETG